MKTWLKIATAALVTVAVAVLLVSAVAAQTGNPDVAAAATEQMCDYCQDYTDAATSAGTVQSTYRPLAGYAGSPYEQAAAPTASRREHRIRLFRIDSE